jgi:intracellular septation protein
MERMMSHQVKLNQKIWSKINLNTSFFMIFLGILNLYVAFNFNEDTWVNFKLFGITSLLLIFVFYIGLIIAKENQ